jgi:hypothetical protein
MKEFFGLNLAVPSTNILKFDDTSKLAFDTSSWRYLLRYISKVEKLPAEFSGSSVATGEALTKLRSEAGSFGSPKGLRQLLTGNPSLLAHAHPPSMLYAAIVWLAQRLHESAASTVSFLQTLLDARSGKDVKAGLQELGTNAGNAMRIISDLNVRLSAFKNEIIAANNALSGAYKADTEILQRQQEEVGALQVRVEGVQKKINDLGFLSSKQKRTGLEQELSDSQQKLKTTVTQSETRRTAIREIESILEDGNWLKSSLDDLMSFLDNLRKVWTDFGSGLTQLAADASDTQLGDLAFVKKALGLDDAIKQWKVIDQAAKQFTVESLVDIPTH